MDTLEDQAPPSILIVDDDPTSIKVLAKILQPECHVHFTTHGDKAVSMAEKQQPDLILLDVIMPDLDGYAVCRMLKQNKITADIPVMFVTAKGEEQYEAIGFEAGGVDYLSKPVKPFLLRARIRTHIELKRKRDLLRTLTTLDALTGIANRRRMDEVMAYEWHRAIRQNRSTLSCIMIDVDYFKHFNDSYGHWAGDECLRKIATKVKDTLTRKTDLVARYGGEEFICILPETDPEGAIKLAEKLRTAVVSLSIPHAGIEIAEYVTISLGVATIIPTNSIQPHVLIETADKQLYRAKQSGRNCISHEDLTV
ncbi:diguanylate cyclase [Pseudomonadota bacterium]